MQVDLEKLTSKIKELSKDTKGFCLESAVFIGEINGNPIRLSVMQKSEADDEYGYEGIDNRHNCIDL